MYYHATCQSASDVLEGVAFVFLHFGLAVDLFRKCFIVHYDLKRPGAEWPLPISGLVR